jgi:Ca2+-binding RTX toxin-like protein
MTVRIWGAESRVNLTDTAGAQNHPQVASLDDGGFVVVWEDHGGTDTDVWAQLYDAAGRPAGANFAISTAVGNQTAPAVTGLAGGGFAVVVDEASPSSLSRLRFNPDGSIAATASVTTGNPDNMPTLAPLGAGYGMVLAFHDTNGDISALRYAADGVSTGIDIDVNTTGTGAGTDQVEPDVAQLASGRFAVVWSTNGVEVRGRVFEATGTALDFDFVVNGVSPSATVASPRITPLAAGGFVVTWASQVNPYPGSHYDVRGRVFDASGDAVGGDFLVNTTTASDQAYADVTPLNDGGFLAVWYDFSTHSIRGQAFDAFGARDGREFPVTTSTTNGYVGAGGVDAISAATLADGRVGVTWQTTSSSLGDADAVHLQVLDPRDGQVEGTPGADLLYGSRGVDQITAQGGSDDVFAMGGDDDVYGGDGQDTLRGQGGDDVLHGGGDDDGLYGAAGADELRGSAGDDSLFGGADDDVLDGGDGDDALDGNAGSDVMAGGAGNDSYDVSEAGDEVVERAGAGTDLVRASVAYTLPGEVEDLALQLLVIEGTGNALDNTLTGNAAGNLLAGLAGNDVLFGMNGNDDLQGGDGIDRLYGGRGDDTLSGGAGRDSFFFAEAAATGTETITDFSRDFLRFDGAVFAGLGAPGRFATDDPRFAAGAGLVAAQDADDRIVYDTASGRLYYDPDGAGGAAAVRIATLIGAPSLAASDLVVF